MQSQKVARRYAVAIFELARERALIAETGRALQSARDALLKSDDVRRFFMSPVIDRKVKEQIVAGALEGRVGELALHSVLLLVRKRREALLAPIVEQYENLALENAGRERLYLTSARKLSEAELEEVVSRLARVYGKTFDVQQKVDPNLVGGLRITLGDLRIDGSIAGRLNELVKELHPHGPALLSTS